MKSGFNQMDENSFIYIPEKYPGPIAIDMKPSKECDEYHKNSYIQVNMNNETTLKKVKS